MPVFAQHINVSLDYLVTLSVGFSMVLLCLDSFLGCGSKNCLAREGRGGYRTPLICFRKFRDLSLVLGCPSV